MLGRFNFSYIATFIRLQSDLDHTQSRELHLQSNLVLIGYYFKVTSLIWSRFFLSNQSYCITNRPLLLSAAYYITVWTKDKRTKPKTQQSWLRLAEVKPRHNNTSAQSLIPHRLIQSSSALLPLNIIFVANHTLRTLSMFKLN